MEDEMEKKGNVAYAAGKFDLANWYFKEAIKLSPDNHLLYSSRAATYCGLKMYDSAFKDALKTIELKPDWYEGTVLVQQIRNIPTDLNDNSTVMHALNVLLGLVDADAVFRTRVVESGDEDISFVMSRAAVYLKLGEDKAALEDPEVFSIVTDLGMKQVFVDFNGDVMAAREHLKSMVDKLAKLDRAGIAQVKIDF